MRRTRCCSRRCRPGPTTVKQSSTKLAPNEQRCWAGPMNGAVAVLFAAAHPDRMRALIVANAWVRSAEDLAYHSTLAQSELDGLEDALVSTWGTEPHADLGFQPDSADDPEYRRWIAKSTRLSSSPREAASYMRHIAGIDLRQALSTIHVPTLVIQRTNMSLLPLEAGLQLEHGIEKARFVQVEGADFSIFTEPNTEILDQIEKCPDRHRPDDRRRSRAQDEGSQAGTRARAHPQDIDRALRDLRRRHRI